MHCELPCPVFKLEIEWSNKSGKKQQYFILLNFFYCLLIRYFSFRLSKTDFITDIDIGYLTSCRFHRCVKLQVRLTKCIYPEQCKTVWKSWKLATIYFLIVVQVYITWCLTSGVYIHRISHILLPWRACIRIYSVIMLVDPSHRCENCCPRSAKFWMPYTFFI